MLRRLRSSRGFTLIEVLLVVAIISILAGIVILAINPSKQLADTRNAQRRADVQTILNAVYQYSIDEHDGLDIVPTEETDICVTGSSICENVDLSVLTSGGKYLVAIPKDPLTADNDYTHYTIRKNSNNRITVNAPDAERDAVISVTR